MLILAHRGAHEPESAGIRENTVDAFRRAAEVGADGVELDVRTTSDGVLVVHHDPLLPDGRAIWLTHSAEMPGWVPTLDAALDACSGLALVDVEIKASPLEAGFDPSYRVAGAVAAVLQPRSGEFMVSSFNLGVLDAFKDAAPETETGWLTMRGFDHERAARDAAARGHGALNAPQAEVSRALVDVAHHLGMRVLAWTVDDPSRWAELDAAGVDMSATDLPKLARSVLGYR